MERPHTHQADLAKLPRALAPLIERPQWAVWRWTQLPNGKWQKPPYMATQPNRHASTKDPGTWADYATALAAVQAGDADGISYVLTENDPFAAIDLDNCRHIDTHSIDVWAQNFMQAAVTAYQEVTPSGAGVRIWGSANGANVNRKFTLEIESKPIAAELFRKTNKALTITGYRLDTIQSFTSIDKVIDWAVIWGERRKAASAPAPKAANGFDSAGAGCGYSIDEIEEFVRTGAPTGKDRSALFHTIVGHYIGCGWSAEQIVDYLAQHPDGIGERYIGEGRLTNEVIRSAGKYGAAAPAWPDSAKAATPPSEDDPELRDNPQPRQAPQRENGDPALEEDPDLDSDVDVDEDEDKELDEQKKEEPRVIPVDLWAKFEAPPLPADLLPAVIKTYVTAQARLMGCDPAGLAMGALTVCAAAIPDGVQVKVKRHDDWRESARIWTALGGPVSAMKSPILRKVTGPINQIDAELSRAYSEAKAIYDGSPAEERKSTPPPKHTRVRIEDATPEAVQPILRDSPDGVLLVRDELSGWFGSIDKYSGSRGGSADRGFWLQAFNGGIYAFDRVSRGSAVIPNLSVSVLGGIQEETLRKVAEDGVDDGLLQRLFTIMLRPAELGRDEPGPLAAGQYEDLIHRLHAMVPDPSIPRQFTDDAQIIRRQLEQKHLDLLKAYERINKKFAAHIGKYNGLYARLCLVWHCIENGDERHISAETARRVADFMQDFVLPHAKVFYISILGLSDQHDRLLAVAGYILAHKLEYITARTIQRGDRTMRGLKRLDIENIFQHLDALGWITYAPMQRISGPQRWPVNPEVHSMFAAKAREEAERRARDRALITASEEADQ